jgi:hypothetical protein
MADDPERSAATRNDHENSEIEGPDSVERRSEGGGDSGPDYGPLADFDPVESRFSETTL